MINGAVTSEAVTVRVPAVLNVTLNVPAVVIEIPWDRVLVLNLVSGGSLAFAVLVIGAALRRLRVGATLRLGEE